MTLNICAPTTHVNRYYLLPPGVGIGAVGAVVAAAPNVSMPHSWLSKYLSRKGRFIFQPFLDMLSLSPFPARFFEYVIYSFACILLYVFIYLL